MNYPRLIKEMRHYKGYTQEQLAAKMGICRGNLSRLETTTLDPKMSTIEKIAGLCDYRMEFTPMRREI